MSKYAENTTVPSDRSRAEIEKTLMRYGADQFMYGTKVEAAAIAFRAKGRHIRFFLPLPDRNASKYKTRERAYRGSYYLSPSEQEARYEQDVRQRWRALALCIKAKLEAVEAGITDFEDEFMAHIVLPNGQTMSEHAKPLIAAAYDTGTMPPLLPHLQ